MRITVLIRGEYPMLQDEATSAPEVGGEWAQTKLSVPLLH